MEDTQDHDVFISLTGTFFVIVNFPKGKGKALKELILKEIVPRGFDAWIVEIKEQHQQAITGPGNQVQGLAFTN